MEPYSSNAEDICLSQTPSCFVDLGAGAFFRLIRHVVSPQSRRIPLPSNAIGNGVLGQTDDIWENPYLHLENWRQGMVTFTNIYFA
jgi:hypothetical protein